MARKPAQSIDFDAWANMPEQDRRVLATEIWTTLAGGQRATLLQEAGFGSGSYTDRNGRTWYSSGSARHALGRKCLLLVGQTEIALTTHAGFHTPRKVTEIGWYVAETRMRERSENSSLSSERLNTIAIRLADGG